MQNFIGIPGTLFKRALALQVGGLDEHLWYAADWDFWLKLAAAGPAVYCPKPLSAFRVHGGSQTILRSGNTRDFRLELQTVLDRHLAQRAQTNRTMAVARAARFSVAVNTALAAAIHGDHRHLAGLIPSFLALGPRGWHRYLRDSRIAERILARLRGRLAPPGALTP